MQRTVWEQLTQKTFTLPGPLPALLRQLALRSRILDVGCGYGRLPRGVVRHFPPADLRRLLADVHITDWQEQTNRTMNGNRVRSVAMVAHKRFCHSEGAKRLKNPGDASLCSA